MRKRFTIRPIGAESSHPKFAGVNNAGRAFPPPYLAPSDFIPPLPPNV